MADLKRNGIAETYLAGEYGIGAIARVIEDDLRRELRTRIMAALENDISSAIEKVVDGLRMRVASHAILSHQGVVFNIITRHGGEKDNNHSHDKESL